MGVKEAITQLEIIATNMIGRLCEIPNENERQIAILNKQIEALDMGIDALKTQIDLVRCGECKYQYMCGHQINRHGLTLKLTCCEYGERRADE